MKIRKNIAAAGVAGVLGVMGLAVAVAPIASATTSTDDGTTTDDSTTSGFGARLQAIKDALAGLVSDGSLTQEQADEVATTLDESTALRGGGHGRGGGMGLEAAADALGMTVDDLRTALAAEGTTLADVAAAEGVDTATLIDALVAEHTARITPAVTDGRITQEEADEKIAALPEHVAAQIEQEMGPGHGPGHGHGGGHGRHGAEGMTGSTDEGTGTTPDEAVADATT